MNSHRKNIMLGTAGHVDHGKTALVKVLTGCDTDTLAEEKQRGLTIDLGFAPCRLAGNRVVGIVDVPGHVDFIRNMVAGAHGIDVVMFVVAADDGIMPQTHEHLHILTLMGLRHGLVALTKIDLVEPDRRQDVVDHLRGLLAGTFLEAAPVCPLSNVRLRVFPDLARHNLKQLLDRGLCVTLNSDDPAYFGGYIGQNFLEAAEALGLSRSDLVTLARNSLQASFVTDAERAPWLAQLETVAGES